MNDTPPLDLLVPSDKPAPVEPPPPPPFTPGIVDDLSNEDYHRIDALSSSGTKTIVNHSLMHYRFERDNPSPPTEAMQLGTATHTAILEPDKLDSVIVVAPDGAPKRPTATQLRAKKPSDDAVLAIAWWQKFDREAAGRLIVTQEQYDCVRRMRDAVYRHPGALRLLDGTQREVSFFWNDAATGAPCKCRPDILQRFGDDIGISDVKTCQDASPQGFGRTIAKFDYHLSAAFYTTGMEHVLHRSPLFFAFIAVESNAPHGVAVYTTPPEALVLGGRKANRAIVAYAEARRTGFWRGYSDFIEPAQMPAWALREPF